MGLGGASGGRARPGVRALSRGGGGACGARGARATCASCATRASRGDAVGGEAIGGLSVLLLRHGGARVLSARGAVPKRGGGSRRRRLLLGRAVLRGPVLRTRLDRSLRASARDSRDDGHDRDQACRHHDQPEPADPHDAEDTDVGEDRGDGGEHHQHASDDGHVEAPFEGLFNVNATVLSLGQEQPGESVGEGNDRHEEGSSRHENAHEREIPPLAGGNACADAADDAGLSAVPARASDGIKEPVGGRALLVLSVGVRCASGPTHHALPLDGIHAAWIDTTTQPKKRVRPIVGDPLNGP